MAKGNNARFLAISPIRHNVFKSSLLQRRQNAVHMWEERVKELPLIAKMPIHIQNTNDATIMYGDISNWDPAPSLPFGFAAIGG